MIPDADQIKMLRAALQASPGNVPLRQHIAQMLLSMGEAEVAEKEFAEALTILSSSGSADAQVYFDLKVGLARSHYQQGKDAQALVILQDILRSNPTHAETLKLHAKLLLRSGQDEQAVAQFRQALIQDKSLLNSDFAEQIGIAAQPAQGPSENWAGEDSHHSIERPSISFTDVGGMESLKEEIRLKIIYPLTHADMYKAYGKSIGGGILMYGPPGCGKTHLARATAGEIRANFISVDISDILDMWLGNSERNLHAMFEQARRHAPCVLFFDEVDALASKRQNMHAGSVHQITNQFLTELDGVNFSNEGVLILAATNAPWSLDSAFRRPGRFDRILFVQPPDEPARTAILRLLCKGKPIDDIDFRLLGKRTDRFSGADLQALVDRAVEKKLQEAMRTGRPTPLTTKDIANAAKSVNPSTREWFSTARNYAAHANQDGTYDEVLTYLNRS